MYEELDEYLSGFFSGDYWYDEGFGYAREMLEHFNDDDWEKLLRDIISKPIEWQVRYAYCTTNGINDEAIIKSLILLSSIDNEELFVTCVDALRDFNSPGNIGIISNNKEIIERVEKILLKCTKITKKIFEDFISKIKE